MSREIIFKGKRVDGKGWVEGDLIHGVGSKKDVTLILPLEENLTSLSGCDPYYGFEVDPATVGQYVGKIGANSCEVWEGDKIIARLNHHGKPTKLEIRAFISFNSHVGTWQISYESHEGNTVSDDIGFRYFLEVVGNIHDTDN